MQTQTFHVELEPKWHQNSEVGKLASKSEVSHSWQYPSRYAVIGEVVDAKSFDELITSESSTGDQIPDFENLHFKIASRPRKLGKTQSEAISCRQTVQ